jgi:hypothetical protein
MRIHLSWDLRLGSAIQSVGISTVCLGGRVAFGCNWSSPKMLLFAYFAIGYLHHVQDGGWGSVSDDCGCNLARLVEG